MRMSNRQALAEAFGLPADASQAEVDAANEGLQARHRANSQHGEYMTHDELAHMQGVIALLTAEKEWLNARLKAGCPLDPTRDALIHLAPAGVTH